MKFLCVPCDSPMRLRATAESEPGSLSVVYECPECGYEMAMLTNAQETQMVRSLGVRIGPAAAASFAAPESSGAPAATATATGIEMVAKEGGLAVIDEAVLAAARTRFGM